MPRGGWAHDEPVCGWYWPADERCRAYHYCVQPRDHGGDHICAEGAALVRTVPNAKYMSTPMIRSRLLELVRETGLYKLNKKPKLADIVTWVIHDLPNLAPDDPRTPEALALAQVLWSHER